MVLPEGILDWLFSITIAMTITAIFALTATLWFMLNRPSAQYYGWIGIAIASTGISLLATIGIAIYAAPVAADVPELMVGAAAFSSWALRVMNRRCGVIRIRRCRL